LAISDALFAAWARADSANAPAVVVAERAALGRALLEQLEAQATALGPPSDTELDALVAERWTEFDRPPRVRTTHAVILVKKPEDAAPVQALAQKLASELDGSTESALFVEKARAFDAKPFELVAERLSPVTADGRVWDPDARPGQQFGTYEVDYARAANALERPGDHSPVVKTVFGSHVILLEERLPELRVPLEERRAALHDDVISRRTKKLLESTLAELHNTTAVERERTEDVLTELVSRSP
jgi:peptidyl-prolyl cis-trans isomerase C